MRYNLAQKQAITHKEGPCMVLAGPGSGKTFTITRRISYLIDQGGVKPEQILVVTFTKAAAGEMKQRFLEERNEKSTRVSFGTFHGIFYSILKWAYHLKSDSILTEEEKLQILKWAVGKVGMEEEQNRENLQEIQGEISKLKNNRLDISTYSSQVCDEQVFKDIYNLYEKERMQRRKVDFDDMLVMTYELFLKRPDLLLPWQEKYEYILVDEFQDINQVQYDVIRMLAEPQNNLFIVGDDDQSIYRFRGSKPEIMLGFPKDYGETKRIMLQENYRSTGNIVDAAERVICHNKGRFLKSMTTQNRGGKSVHIQEVRDCLEESQYVAEEIQKRVEKGMKSEQIAVLYRSTIDARILTETFMERNIPFHMKEQMFNIYEHFIGKDIRAYMSLANNDMRRSHFLNIMNRPNRYFQRECVEDEIISFEQLRFFYEDKDWMLDRIDQMEADIKVMSRMAPYAAIQYIRKRIGYDDFLKEYARKRNVKWEDMTDILCQIEEKSREFLSIEEWFSHIEKHGENLRKLSKQREDIRQGVSFMTMHGAKGLEFDTVFIIGANEKVTPYKRAESREEIEEERRMFYVAMTRAKRELIISYAAERAGKVMERSRFVDEILGIE